MQETQFNPWIRKIPWRREWQPTPVFLPGKFYGQRSLVSYRAWGCKELDRTEQLTLPLSGYKRKLLLKKQWDQQPSSQNMKMNTKWNFFKVGAFWCFPGGSVVKNLPANARDAGSISGLGRSPGEGNGNPLQYSCLENPTGRGAWSATVHGVAKSRTWLSSHVI